MAAAPVSTVSLCMIVRNEASNLGACLQSVKGLFGDVVVVDTGSTDGTQDLARAAGARVFEFPWCDDFSAARNESIRYATGDFVFWLDADDRVPEASHAALKELLASLKKGEDQAAYLLQVVTPGPNGVPSRQLPQARLFPNRADVRWEYRVHEQIGRAVQRAGLPLRMTRIVIVHTGYTDDATVRAKLERNLRLSELDCQSGTTDGVPLFHRATTLLDLRRTTEALVALRRCEKLTEGTTLAQSLPSLITRALAVAGDLPGALAEVRRGLARYPGDTTLLYNEAEIVAALGDFALAERRLRAQLRKDEQHGRFGTADRTIAAMRVRHLLAEVLLLSGRHADAEATARRVLDEHPTFGQAWMTVGEALLAQRKMDALEAVHAKLAGSAAASAGDTALRALEASARRDHDAARALVDGALATTPGHAILLRTKARVVFAAGARGDELREVMNATFEHSPLCARTHGLARRIATEREKTKATDTAS